MERMICLQPWQLLILLLFLLISNLHQSEAQPVSQLFPYPLCGENGNYTASSTYQSNLQSILSSLPSNVPNNGFYSGSIGNASDLVTASAFCSADLQLEECRNCISDAATDILQSCPLRREAVLHQEFCMVRYSNQSFIGILSATQRYLLHNSANVASVDQFTSIITELLDDLRNQAISGGPLLKVGAGIRIGPSSMNISAISQCTPDLSSNDCQQCLVIAQQSLTIVHGSQGAISIYPSCRLRYEIYPFINFSRIQQVESQFSPPRPPPPPSIPPSVSPPTPPTGNSTRTIIIIVVTVTVAACVVVGGYLFFVCRRKKKNYRETAKNGDDGVTLDSIQYDINKIKAATNDFSEVNELGRGGFGTVYKGVLENGEEIAVKRLSKGSTQGDSEFMNEVEVLANLQHRNLVRLLGFSIQGMERLLVYEFLNGSLEKYIFDPVERSKLDWNSRYNIIWGIAKGLLYLHEDSRYRIIHRDLKPSNILLDAKMNSKIADFGLARLFPLDETQVNTSKVVGTHGYMAPEYAYHGQLSVKIDLFSFGVIVLEIISGQKNTSFVHTEASEVMLSFAWKCWHEGNPEKIVDPTISKDQLQEILRCIHIALLCVQESPSKRPSMTSVVHMLNSGSITIPIPTKPAYFFPNVSDESSVGFNKSSSDIKEKALRKEASVNEITMTDMNAR